MEITTTWLETMPCVGATAVAGSGSVGQTGVEVAEMTGTAMSRAD
jgi:hypothetical protein